MNYKINFQSQDYLEHHGILGQRWGHRNGPPYPLDSEDHSSSEKKAGWKKSLSKDGSDNSRKTFSYKRHMSAANKIQKDADNLRAHGYETEAKAVQKVADKHREKANSSQLKYETEKREYQMRAEDRKKQKEKIKEDKRIRKEEQRFERNYNSNWWKSYNKATDQFNNSLSEINKRFEGKYESKEYVKAVSDLWMSIYKDRLLNDFGESPKYGEAYVNNAPFMNTYLGILDEM